MRDVDRLREKIQLSLDDRQIAVLAVCALLLLGGVFSLGVLVGKRLAAAAPQPAPVNDLAALDELQAATPGKPPPRAGEPPRAAEPLKKPAPVAARPPPPAEELDRDPDEQPVPEQGKPPEETPAQAAKGAAKPLPGQAALAPAQAATAAPVVIDPPPGPRTIEPAPDRVAVTAPPRNLGAFTVQIGASQDHADAQRLESRARLAGLKPYVVEARLGNKGTWYRVRVGSFNDKDSANNFRRDVERELRLTAMVMPTR